MSAILTEMNIAHLDRHERLIVAVEKFRHGGHVLAELAIAEDERLKARKSDLPQSKLITNIAVPESVKLNRAQSQK